ncbi:MAG: hypothetical protein AB8C84_00350 [Oligoflexales bacterium]
MKQNSFFFILLICFLKSSSLIATPNFTSQNMVIAKNNVKKKFKKNKKDMRKKFKRTSKKMKKTTSKKIKKKTKGFITGYKAGFGNGSFLNSGYHLGLGADVMNKHSFEVGFENSATNTEEDTSTLFKNMSILTGGIRYSFFHSFNAKIFLQREAYAINYETLISGSLLKLEYLQAVSYFGLTVGNTWKYHNFYASIDWGGYLYPFYYEEPVITGLSNNTAFEINTQADIVASTLIARTMMLKVTVGVSI